MLVLNIEAHQDLVAGIPHSRRKNIKRMEFGSSFIAMGSHPLLQSSATSTNTQRLKTSLLPFLSHALWFHTSVDHFLLSRSCYFIKGETLFETEVQL